MSEGIIDYTNDWYDFLNDCYTNQMSYEIISGYLEVIEDTDNEPSNQW